MFFRFIKSLNQFFFIYTFCLLFLNFNSKDHPDQHTTILGGMWGLKISSDLKIANEVFDLMTNNIVSHRYNENQSNPPGQDQLFLTVYVWPFAKLNATAHDSYTCEFYVNSKPFPTRRLNRKCYIGSKGSCNNTTMIDQKIKILPTCPKECRPRYHQDWLYC